MFDYSFAAGSEPDVLKEIAFDFWYLEWLFAVELDYLRKQAGLSDAVIAAVREALNYLSYWLFSGECPMEIQSFRDHIWAL